MTLSDEIKRDAERYQLIKSMVNDNIHLPELVLSFKNTELWDEQLDKYKVYLDEIPYCKGQVVYINNEPNQPLWLQIMAERSSGIYVRKVNDAHYNSIKSPHYLISSPGNNTEERVNVSSLSSAKIACSELGPDWIKGVYSGSNQLIFELNRCGDAESIISTIIKIWKCGIQTVYGRPRTLTINGDELLPINVRMKHYMVMDINGNKVSKAVVINELEKWIRG